MGDGWDVFIFWVVVLILSDSFLGLILNPLGQSFRRVFVFTQSTPKTFLQHTSFSLISIQWTINHVLFSSVVVLDRRVELSILHSEYLFLQERSLIIFWCMSVHFLEVKLLQPIWSWLHLFLSINKFFNSFIIRVYFLVSLEIVFIGLFFFSQTSSEESIIAFPPVSCSGGHSLLSSVMIVRVSELSIVEFIYFLEDSIQFVNSSFYFHLSSVILLAHGYSLIDPLFFLR